MLLVHDGRQVDVTRKTLACIHHLIENRHRVVGYDELIRTLWGHDNVTNTSCPRSSWLRVARSATTARRND